MNTKQILIAMAVATAMSATAAMAQTAAPAPAAAPAAQSDSSSKAKPEGKFEDRKARALKRLAKSAAKIQEKQACAEASTDNKSLDKCFPKRGKGGKWHKRGGKGANKSDTGAASAPAAPADQ